MTHSYPISAVPHATPRQPQGPLAVPGNYRVRLTFDGQRFEAPLTLKPDPRVRASADALARQLSVATNLAAFLTQSSQALLTAQSVEAQLKALAPAGAVAEPVRRYQARLGELTGSAEQKPADGATVEAKPPAPPTGAAPASAAPETNLKDAQEQIAGLYAEVTRGDGAPTAAQLAATATVQGTLAGLMATWQKLQTDLPDLNRQLKAAKLTPIRTDLPPPRDANIAGED
jgi:uncharacterized phage infection (PIP) family protein YhgE